METAINEFNFEVYTKHPKTGETGWDLKFVSVIADTKEEAKEYLKQWPLFDCIITHDYTVRVPFDGNLATLIKGNGTRKAGRGWIVELDGHRGAFYRDVLFTAKVTE